MRVYELIEQLQKCNPADFVMYDATAAFDNDGLTAFDDMGNEYKDRSFPVDDVLVGHGTIRGIVYLAEDKE